MSRLLEALRGLPAADRYALLRHLNELLERLAAVEARLALLDRRTVRRCAVCGAARSPTAGRGPRCQSCAAKARAAKARAAKG